jgi:protein-S-isoprenylcysteine O-methyltransferase Ste14
MAGVLEWPLHAVLGLALFLAGAASAGWAWALHRAAGNALAPGATPRVLMDEGPWRISRNPMYLGLLAMLAGLALAWSSVVLGLATVGLALLLHGRQIPREEAHLARQFGGWWHDYAAEVRRWL